MVPLRRELVVCKDRFAMDKHNFERTEYNCCFPVQSGYDDEDLHLSVRQIKRL